MHTVSEIVRKFGTTQKFADLVNDCNPGLSKRLKRHTVEWWIRSDRIPSVWFVPIVNAANEQMIPLTERDLARICAQHIMEPERVVISGVPDQDAAA